MENIDAKDKFVQAHSQGKKQGAQLNNMGTPNHVYTGIDWLRTFCFGSFKSSSLIDLLYEKREKALENGEAEAVWIGENRIFVQPAYAWGKGKNSLQIICRYRGIEFALNRRDEEEQKKIEFLVRGEALTEQGLENVRDRIAEIKEMVGLIETRECVGEVHFCVDVRASTSELIMNCIDDQVVTRAKKWNLHGQGVIGGRFSTLEIGRRHKLFLRIYDKEAELTNAGEKKEEVYRRCISEGEVFDDLTRVEFEVGREALVERNIDTYEDLMNSAEDLLNYLAFEWFRVHDDKIDRVHTWRGRLCDAWRFAVRGFQELADKIKNSGRSTFRKVVREPNCTPSHTRLMRMTSGYIANYFVWMREKPDEGSIFELVKHCVSEIQKKFFGRFQNKNGESFSDYLERIESSGDVSRTIQKALQPFSV